MTLDEIRHLLSLLRHCSEGQVLFQKTMSTQISKYAVIMAWHLIVFTF